MNTDGAVGSDPFLHVKNGLTDQSFSFSPDEVKLVLLCFRTETLCPLIVPSSSQPSRMLVTQREDGRRRRREEEVDKHQPGGGTGRAQRPAAAPGIRKPVKK
ncbi:hypothetical protein CHARACLAT_002908 [Characodon lateralis]|uniref:Uncharacterized protein n=1 Tax=Characodon lateralis TaxID=208331 RepID=A0ABU7CUB1_9TELE|nr:hypothetical protein [Characodon lateralis]